MRMFFPDEAFAPSTNFWIRPSVIHRSMESDADPAREISEKACTAFLPGLCCDPGPVDRGLRLRSRKSGIARACLRRYLCGGWDRPENSPQLKDGTFFRAFCDKTLLSPVLARIPIYVVLNEDAPVWGAAYQALAAGQNRQLSNPHRKAW